jgi:tRNA A-37 threonylcarbamoyl transferase component Bud32
MLLVMSSCPQCSASVSAQDRFCGDCGTPLVAGVETPERTSSPLDDLRDERAQSSAPLPEDAHAAHVATTSMAASGEGAGAAVALAVESAGLSNSTPLAQDESDVVSPSDVVAQSDAAEQSDANAHTGDGGEGDAESQSRIATAGEVELSSQATDGQESRGSSSVNAGESSASRDTGGREARGGAGDSVRTSDERAGWTVRGGATGGRRASMTKPLEAGTLLYSRYEIVRRIGGGGMGAVYLAKDRNLGDQPRAVKEMIQSNIDESQHEKAINDFRRESMLLSSLEHQSIPTIYDYFYDDGAARFYLVMKYISGGDFLARLRNAPAGRIDEKTVTDWACQVADVLNYLHKQNPPIIYRDLKPANLMIDGNSGRVMLIDFGIARWVQKEEKGVTAVGTMGYAPPELFSGKVEPRSDIYSLGATMFHLLTGADPQDNPLLIFDFNKNPRPRQITPSMSNEMEAILMRAVEYKPEGRFRSAAELRDTLGDHLEKLRAGQVTYGMTPGGASANLKTMQVEMVYCGFCGGRIAADDVYCAHCGQRQPMAVASAALRQARATAKLVVMGTTELDSSFLLQKDSSLVGRSDPHSKIFPEVDLSRFDPQTKISRRHARIFRKGDTYLVEDLGSVNGTVVNDTLRLAPHQPRALESGDKLRLGETTLHFLIG